MCNTVQGLVKVVGQAADDHERQFLLEADRRAAAFLAEGTGVLMSDGSGHYRAFAELAREIRPEQQAKAENALRSLDTAWEALREQIDAPSDVAGDVYNFRISAAYYLGLAVAFRLASGEVR